MVIDILPTVSGDQANDMAKHYGCKLRLQGRERHLITGHDAIVRQRRKKHRSVLAGSAPWPQLATPSNDDPEPPSAA